jgi:hypothetical protein
MAARRYKVRLPLSNRLIKVAWVCGLIPLAAVSAGFIGWAATCAPIFAGIAVLSFLLGIVSILVGYACLFTHYVLSAGRTPPKPGRWSLRRLRWGAAIVLLANLPVGVGYGLWADYLNSFFYVIVRNESKATVPEFKITSGGKSHSIRNLAPGGVYRMECRYRPDQMSACDLTRNGKITHEDLFGEGPSPYDSWDLLATIRENDVDWSPAPTDHGGSFQ